MANPKIIATLPYDISVDTLKVTGSESGSGSGYTTLYEGVPTLDSISNLFVTNLTTVQVLPHLHTPFKLDVNGETYILTPKQEGMWAQGDPPNIVAGFGYVGEDENGQYIFFMPEPTGYVGKTFKLSYANTGGITPYGELQIIENGEVNVAEYASATVNVPQGVTPSGTININSNGTTNVSEYEFANVNVSSGIVSRNITVQNNSSAAINVALNEEGIWTSQNIAVGDSYTFKCPATNLNNGKHRVRFFALVSPMSRGYYPNSTNPSSNFPVHNMDGDEADHITYMFWFSDYSNTTARTIVIEDKT